MMTPVLLSLLVAATCGSGVEVRLASDKTLDLEIKAAPVSRVLECLSELAGFKFVIEPGLATNQPVTISLSRQTPMQAVNGVLDGLRLNYAYSSDPSGSRILLLLVSSLSDRTPLNRAAPRGAPPSSPMTRRESQPAPPEPDVDYQAVPPTDRLPPNLPPTYFPPAYVPPGQSSLYPEALPLSPLTLRDSRQIHTAALPSGVTARPLPPGRD